MKRVLVYALLLALCGLFIIRTPALTRMILRSYRVVLCAGDSITADSYPQWLHLKFKEKGYGSVKVINMGRDGYTSGEYLNFLRLETEWKRVFPDIVLLQLGTNDVRVDSNYTSTDVFYQNMSNIIRLLRNEAKSNGRKIDIILSTIPPVVEGNSFDTTSIARVTKEINPAIRTLGQEMGLQVVDTYTFFIQSPDFIQGIHPTQKGYRNLANHWFRHIRNRVPAKS